MADSASELESDTSSIDGCSAPKTMSVPSYGELQKKVETLQQENKCLVLELETAKLRCKALQEENKALRRASVNIHARAEQEEEFISNTLMKKIQSLKNEKETLARNYEQEEEYLTNDLSRKLSQLRQEKNELEQTLEKAQEYQVNKLMRRIDRLEAETENKQTTLEQLRREKVELENSLEAEQEALVNRLWKRMDKLEAEKRILQEKLDQPVSAPPSPRDMQVDGDVATGLSKHIQFLKSEVMKLRNQLTAAQQEHQTKMVHYAQEERQVREENLRLQRKLQMEIERREALCRHLSESESSLEMDDERHFNEMTKNQEKVSAFTQVPPSSAMRPTNVSSPIPMQTARPLSPGIVSVPMAFSPPSPMRCSSCMHSHPPHSHCTTAYLPGSSPPVYSHMPQAMKPPRLSQNSDRFIKPQVPFYSTSAMSPGPVPMSPDGSTPSRPTQT